MRPHSACRCAWTWERVPTGTRRTEAPSKRAAGCVTVKSNSGRPSMRRLLSARSEEHTSELQSQSNLVCRLLLEKKKPHSRYSSQKQVGSNRSHLAMQECLKEQSSLENRLLSSTI